jgi:hypothetical protein
MTHEEQVAIAIELFSDLKRIKEIKSRGTPRSERTQSLWSAWDTLTS